MQKLLLLGCLCIHLCLISTFANAISFAGKRGAVMARTVLLDEGGKPILVEYDETGEEVGVPIDYDIEFSKLTIMSVFQYEQEQIRLEKFEDLYKTTLAKDAEVMSRETFLQGSYPTADGKSTITFSEVGNKVTVTVTRQEGGATTADFPLPSYVKSVYVRGRSYRIEPRPEQLVLLSFSVDLSKEESLEGKKTLLMGEKGEIIYKSQYNIAPRTGFFGDPNLKHTQYSQGEGDGYQGYMRKNEDPIFGPVKDVKVFIDNDLFKGSVSATDDKGKYNMHFLLPSCPGGADFRTDIWVELFYKNFNPNGYAVTPYYLRREDWTYCYEPFPFAGGNLAGAMAYVNALAISATTAVPFYNADFRVDVMFLTGRFLMRNPDGSVIELTNTTEYQAEEFDESDPANWVTQNHYDFDNDGQEDEVALGIMEEQIQEDGTKKQVFVKKTLAEIPQEQLGKALQAVYFSSNTEQPAAGQEREPDLIRVADTAPKQKKSDGLLKTISEEDLRQTDIYVFRESTGELVLERNGLTESEATALPPREIQLGFDTGVAKDEEYFYYRLMLRGRYDRDLNVGGGHYRTLGWEEWAKIYQLSEPFQKRDADHLRSGEWIRIVAINRKTGYVGTQRVQLSDISQNKDGMLNVKLEDTYLEPPNLKVWAQRKYKNDKGMLKNIDEEKERHNIIGQEGVALTSDTYIEVFTEWLDADGRPLPEGLGGAGEQNTPGKDFGLTGRLARSAGGNTLIAAGSSDLDNFPIPPGRNIQVLKISDNLTTPEHFYVHVSGTAMAQDPGPNFDEYNTAEGLAGRPKYFTPFLTPVFDEEDTWQTWNAYRGIKRDRAEEENPDPEGEPAKPLPSYVWKYRPEYQFSQYDLEVAEINRITETESGSEEKTNILNANTPVVASADKLIEILYSLTNPTNDRISPIEGPQDLVFAFGEEEVRVTFGADKQIRFENIEHLASLTPEDLLSIRLYSNQDAGNILWEYAFYLAAIYPEPLAKGEYIEVSADDVAEGDLPIYAAVLNAEANPNKELFSVKWSVEGDASITPPADHNIEGTFASLLKISTKKDTKATVNALMKDTTNIGLLSATYFVTAGKVADIEVESQGETVIGGLGGITITATLKDAYQNLVEDGTLVDIEAPDMLVDGDLKTLNGKITFKVKGTSVAGEKQLKIKADDYEETHSVTVDDVDMNISVASSIETGTRDAIVNVSFSSDYGNLSGLKVSLSNHRGILGQKDFVLDSSQQVTTRLNVGDFRGEGKVFAYVGEKIVERVFNVVDPAGSPYILDTVIVSDQAAPGNFSVAGLDVQYTNQTAIMIPGVAGESVDVSLVDYLSPALIPTLNFPMNTAPVAGVVTDVKRGHLGTSQNIDYTAVMSPGGIGAFQFASASEVRVNESDGLEHQGNAGVVFAFKPGALDGVLVDYQAAGLRVELGNAGKLQVVVESDQQAQPFILQSDQAITVDQWYQVGAHIIAGELVLQVNDTINKMPIPGQVAISTSGYSVKIGGSYEGLMAGFSLYDWSEEQTIGLANNQLSTSAIVGNDGFARVPIKTRPSAFIAANFERYQRLIARENKQNPLGLILNSAYADVPAGCQQFTPDDTNIFSWGEAYFKFIAQCRLQSAIDQAKVHITTADGKVERTVAMMNYATLQLIYYQTYATGVVIGSVPGCVNGAVTGNVDSGAAMTCDLVTSLLLIGDIRDFVIHGAYLFTGATDDAGNEKFNKPVFIFASLGILTTLAELTGVGVVLDAAIAGCKSAAKVLTGSKVMIHLADEIDEAVLSKPITQIPGEAKKYLQIMQVVSLVAFYGEDVRKFVVQAISEPEDLKVWIDFLKIYIAKYGGDVVASNISPDTWKIQLFNSAYAGISDDLVAKLTTQGVKEFMELLENVSKTAPKLRGDQTQIGKAFTNAIAELKRLYDSPVEPSKAEIAAIFHKTPSIKAFWVISHIAKGPGLTAMRNFPCVPSNCPMKTMEKFMEDVANIVDLAEAGKITEEALTQMPKVFESLGHITKTSKETDNIGKVNLNMARGAVGVITSLRRITDKKVIDGFEVPGNVINLNERNIGKRIMDVRATDGTLFEVKGWKDKAKSFEYLLGKVDDEGGTVAGKISAQLLKDIVARVADKNDKRIWMFADESMEALKPEFAKKIIEVIKKDKAMQQHIANSLGVREFDEFYRVYLGEGKLQDVINSLMVAF